ncbi:MAG TPA: HlyD family secretion protein [Lacunisphaera sp.]|jgi:membrane fusion protein (multidrug efflux system)|nr:HlyD family secretion protein [Lacunisphaera sp.]
MSHPTDQNPAETPPRRRTKRRVLLIAGPVILAIAGLVLYLHGGRVISSDNAYVHAAKLTVTSEVPGSVTAVAVHENELVQAGQLLFQLDDSLYRIRLGEARARLESTRTEVATLRASYRQKLAQVAEARETVAFGERELARQQTLSAGQAGTEAAVDRARHALDEARKHLDVLQQDAATVLASLSGDPDLPDDKSARLAAARAEVDAAQRNLDKTAVRAPSAGVVTNVTNLPVGKFLEAGQPAFSLVSARDLWIEANLKETELTYVKAGDAVQIEIDTYPQAKFHGQVLNIGPATGAEFALIPAQNASGNWVKVVQRIPVRISVESPDPAYPLRAGMSAEVDIDTGHVRSLGGLFGATTGR